MLVMFEIKMTRRRLITVCNFRIIDSTRASDARSVSGGLAQLRSRSLPLARRPVRIEWRPTYRVNSGVPPEHSVEWVWGPVERC